MFILLKFGGRVQARLRGEEGFTLLEMLIALAIFSIVGVATFSLLKTGVAAYRRIEERKHDQIARRITFDRLQADLQNLLPKWPMPFSGDEREIRFASPAGDSGRALAEIHWAFVETADGRSGWLVRSSRELQRENTQSDTLLSGVRLCRFQFLAVDTTSARWAETWSDPNRIPVAVRMRIAFQAEAEQAVTFAVRRGAALKPRRSSPPVSAQVGGSK